MKEEPVKKLGIMIAVTLVLIISCNDGGTGEVSSKTYAIGETGPSGVGIVFYITDGGLHGLEAAPYDQITSTVWISGGSTQTTLNNTATEIGTGMENSKAITDQTGHTGSAAQVCRDYNGGGFSDWFLPSKDELNQLYMQKGIVGRFTSSAYYWSSSERYSYSAWVQYFDSGVQADHLKQTTGRRARAIRAF